MVFVEENYMQLVQVLLVEAALVGEHVDLWWLGLVTIAEDLPKLIGSVGANVDFCEK